MRRITLSCFTLLIAFILPTSAQANYPVYTSVNVPQLESLHVAVSSYSGTPHGRSPEISISIVFDVKIKYFDNPVNSISVVLDQRDFSFQNCQPVRFGDSSIGSVGINPLSPTSETKNSDGSTSQLFTWMKQWSIQDSGRDWCDGQFYLRFIEIQDISGGVRHADWRRGDGVLAATSGILPTTNNAVQGTFFAECGVNSPTQVSCDQIAKLIDTSQTTFTLNRENAQAWIDKAADKAAADKAVASKKIILTCVKGKLTKKLIAVKPACPKGYKKK